jgi:hypothetical protein
LAVLLVVVVVVLLLLVDRRDVEVLRPGLLLKSARAITPDMLQVLESL